MIRVMEHNLGASLESFISRFPKKYYENDAEIIWQLIGSANRNIPLYEVRDHTGTKQETGSVILGANGRPFYLVFQEDWFYEGNTIYGPYLERYPVRVIAPPVQEGTNFVYKVELMNGSTTGVTIDAGLFYPGTKFNAGPNFVEKELSRNVGGLRYAAPITMRNEFSRIRLHDKQAGNLIDKKLAIAIPKEFIPNGGQGLRTTKNSDGSFNLWMHLVLWTFEKQFAEDKNWALVYGRSNRTSTGEYLNYGKSKNVIQTGAGFREQAGYGYKHYYNTFSIKLLEDALLMLSTGSIPLTDRVFVVETGSWGMYLAHKAIATAVSGWMPAEYFGSSAANPALIEKVKTEYHQNSLAAGFQFTEWRAPMGITVKFKLNTMNDDPQRNTILIDGHPAESERFDIYYLGTQSGEPNIQLAAVRGQEEMRGYRWGPFRNAYTGQLNNDSYGTYDGEDSCEIEIMATLGVTILDPTRIYSLIPNILAGA